MVIVAYCVFTFLASLLGLGLGLAIHLGSLKRQQVEAEAALAREADTAEDLADFATSAWEALRQVQQTYNRRFALHMFVPGAVPLIAAAIGWNMRSDVVATLCSGIAHVADKTPLCF